MEKKLSAIPPNEIIFVDGREKKCAGDLYCRLECHRPSCRNSRGEITSVIHFFIR